MLKSPLMPKTMKHPRAQYFKQLFIAIIFFCTYSPCFAADEQDAITQKIKNNLFFPRKFKQSDKVAVISFDVQTQGRITNLVTNKNSVADEIVNQCLLAIHKSEPFENISSVQHVDFTCKNSKHSDNAKLIEHYDSKLAKQYMNNVQKQIKSNWHPIKYKSGYTVGLRFKVDKAGKAYDIHNALSSGNPDNDLMAVKAVETASPFSTPPSFFFEKADHIDIEFTLDYNIKARSSALSKVNLGLNILDLLAD